MVYSLGSLSIIQEANSGKQARVVCLQHYMSPTLHLTVRDVWKTGMREALSVMPKGDLSVLSVMCHWPLGAGMPSLVLAPEPLGCFPQVDLFGRNPEPRRNTGRLCAHGDVKRIPGYGLLERNPRTIFPLPHFLLLGVEAC